MSSHYPYAGHGSGYAPYASPPQGGPLPNPSQPYYGAPPPGNLPTTTSTASTYSPVPYPYPGPQPSAPPGAPYGGYPSAPPGHSTSFANSPYAPLPSPYSGIQPSAPPGGPYGTYPAPLPQPYAGYGTPFAALVPSSFPPGTDPNVIACFQIADQDGSGLIDDKELQRALSSYNQSFSIRTVHLLMFLFSNSNTRKIGPKEFIQIFYNLQNWRTIFERSDRDRSGKIDTSELREALYSLGFSVSPPILNLLVSKFDKRGGNHMAIEYDSFVECCIVVKGLTEKFKEKDFSFSGSATFTYESFMLTVLPFLVA